MSRIDVSRIDVSRIDVSRIDVSWIDGRAVDAPRHIALRNDAPLLDAFADRFPGAKGGRR